VRKDNGFTLIELLIVVAVIGVVAAIGIPSLLRARVAANEGSAIASLRIIGTAQAAYYAHAGTSGYARSLTTLATSCPGNNEPFISPDLALDPSVKSGYRFVLQASAAAQPARPDCNGTATDSDFYATAVPLSHGTSGVRAFATNNRASIYFDPSGVAPTEAAMAPNGNGRVIE
jgi:prepilin-type N-terminal cleavage/methylation domain-containing protein